MNSTGPSLAVRLYLPMGLLVLVFAVYSNAINNPFLFSDQSQIVASADVTDPEGIVRLWKHQSVGEQAELNEYYRPVTVLSYHLQARFNRFILDARLFRTVNIVLLWMVGWSTALWLGRYFSPTAAWLAAVLVAIHPTSMELVNHISCRSELLAALGVLLFAYFQRGAIRAEGWSVLGAACALMAAGVAIGSSFTGWAVIPLAAAQCWLGHRGRLARTWEKQNGISNENGTGVVVAKMVHVITALLLMLPAAAFAAGKYLAIDWSTSYQTTGNDLTTNPLLRMNFFERLPSAISLARVYLRLLPWPVPRFNFMPISMPDWSSETTILGLTILICMVLVAPVVIRWRNALCLSLVIAWSQYLLVGNILWTTSLYASSRYMLMFVLAGVIALAAVIDRLTAGSERNTAVSVIPCAILTVVMGVQVFLLNFECRSAVDARMGDLERQPGNAVAMFHYAAALNEVGRYQDAYPWFERIVEQRPESKQARYELAGVLMMVGRPGAAREQYERIIELNPTDLRALKQLAVMALQGRDLEAAQKYLGAARAMAPEDSIVMHGLALLERKRGNLAESQRCYEELLRKYPDHDPGKSEYAELLELIKFQANEMKMQGMNFKP